MINVNKNSVTCEPMRPFTKMRMKIIVLPLLLISFHTILRHRRRYVRVVKETDLKSVGLRPRRFEPCCRRFLLLFHSILSLGAEKKTQENFSFSFFLRNKQKLFLFARESFSATKQILNSDGRQNSDRDNEP